MKSKAFLPLVVLLALARPASPADERLAKLSADHRRWLEEEVVYIITDKEKEVFLNLQTREERDLFIEVFWERRDPKPAAAGNEFKTEHYRRLEYANKYFSRDAPRPGWRTDRGRFYIILGEPLEKQLFDGLNEVVTTEIWFYQGDTRLGLPARFNLVFFKEGDIGEHKLYHPYSDGPEALLRGGALLRTNQNLAVDALEIVSMDLARASLTIDLTEPSSSFLSGRNTRQPLTPYVRPSMGVNAQLAAIEESPRRRVSTDYLDAHLRYKDRVSADYSFKFVPNRSYFAVLSGPKNTPFVHYSLELDPQNLSLETGDDETKFYTILDVSLEVRDLKGNLIAMNDNAVSLELSASQMEQVQALPFAYQDDFPLLPGDYKLSLILKNRVSKQYTVAEQELRVESTPGKPALGGLILGYQNELVGGSKEGTHLTFQIGGNRIHPASEGVFTPGQTVHVFSQVLEADPEYRLRFALLDGDRKLQERESKVADYQGGPVIEPFSLVGVAGGSYAVRVQLIDPSGKPVAEKSADLQVSPRTAIPRPGFIYRRGFNTEVSGLLALARGQQLMALGRFAEAQSDLEEAVAAGNPELPMARWKLAGAYLYLGKADQALELLLPIKDQFPNEYELAEGLGLAYYFKKDFTRAVEQLERAMTLRPPDASLLNALGDSYQQLGKPEKAREAFERSLQLNPDQEAVRQRLASVGKSD